uniref:Ubiquitin-like protease family profile domain-containing protein n=1 Tax=Acrobeloides nanus TaxID=290746 RepID=A0A914EKZ9_9BILA
MVNSDDAKVLSYDDIVVFQSDIRSLNGHSWLTDNIVNFAANYMKNVLINDATKEKVCIVYASCCELIKYTEKNQLQELLSSFEIDPMKWNIFMFNDNSDPTLIYGGTHWSLIVFSPTERTFYLFDSSNYNVPAHIENFTKKLYNFCNPSEEKVHAYDCPKMNISGDCGIFAIEYLKAILLHINSGNTSSTFQFPVMNDQFVMDRRMYWRNIIYTLSNS